MSSPVSYRPDIETIQPVERETICGLEDQFEVMLDTTLKDDGHVGRQREASDGVAGIAIDFFAGRRLSLMPLTNGR
jgi:hypothetical protein